MIRCGVFKYSKEDGTPAEKLKNQVHHTTKEKRYKLIMQLQKQISENKMKSHIGKELEILIESEITNVGAGVLDSPKQDNAYYYIGRSRMDVADVDGIVFVKADKPNLVNTFVKCKIIDVREYDLIAELN